MADKDVQLQKQQLNPETMQLDADYFIFVLGFRGFMCVHGKTHVIQREAFIKAKGS